MICQGSKWRQTQRETMMTEMAPIAPVAGKPAHVSDELVYDFDLHADPGLARDPHQRILELSEITPPVFWSPYAGGTWVLRGHQAVYKASRDWETFTSEFVP